MVDRTVAAAGTVVAEIATLRQKLAAAALEQFTSVSYTHLTLPTTERV